MVTKREYFEGVGEQFAYAAGLDKAYRNTLLVTTTENPGVTRMCIEKLLTGPNRPPVGTDCVDREIEVDTFCMAFTAHSNADGSDPCVSMYSIIRDCDGNLWHVTGPHNAGVITTMLETFDRGPGLCGLKLTFNLCGNITAVSGEDH